MNIRIQTKCEGSVCLSKMGIMKASSWLRSGARGLPGLVSFIIIRIQKEEGRRVNEFSWLKMRFTSLDMATVSQDIESSWGWGGGGA